MAICFYRYSNHINQLTPSHRDRKGRPEWYDLLINYSDIKAIPELFIEDIGLKCQNSVVRTAEYGQSVGVRSVGVSDVQTQGSKTQLKLMCFALATGTGVVFVFRRVGVTARDRNRVGRSVDL